GQARGGVGPAAARELDGIAPPRRAAERVEQVAQIDRRAVPRPRPRLAVGTDLHGDRRFLEQHPHRHHVRGPARPTAPRTGGLHDGALLAPPFAHVGLPTALPMAYPRPITG